jgi:hypothetical protein
MNRVLLERPSVVKPIDSFPTFYGTLVPLLPIRATCPTHLILLDSLIILGEEYKSQSSSLCSFFYCPVTSSLFGPNILLSTLFSNTLSLCSSLNVRDQIPHPYRAIGKIIVLDIVIFKIFDSRQEDRRFWTEW